VTLIRAFGRAGALLSVPALLAAQQKDLPLKHDPRPTVPAITGGDLMTRLYIFADDSMMGRATGTEGHVKSTAYLADELRRLGLQPGGDEGSYFQYVPMVQRALDMTSSLDVGGAPIRVGSDIVPIGRGVARPLDGAQVIFGGTTAQAELTPEQTRGKVVLLTGTQIGSRARYPDAAGIFVAVSDSVLSSSMGRGAATTLAMRGRLPVQFTYGVSHRAAEVMLGAPLASATAGMLGRRIAGDIRYTETEAPARNVVAILRGSDPRLAGQYVALGAHNDHTGIARAGRTGYADHDSLHIFRRAAYERSGPELQASLSAARVALDSVRRLRPARMDSVRNGADDDGSGSVTLLELAEAFATSAVKPRRSILFVWHTGEENGLLGSRWISDHMPVPVESVVAQLNMDMVGRGAIGDIPGGGEDYLQLVGSRRLSTELGDLVEAVNAQQRRPFKFDYSLDADGHPERIYCRSDHYNYARLGIPVVFFTTGLHGDYHQVTDEPQYIDYPHMAHIGQFVYDVALRIANTDKRPAIDKAKPDPQGTCRQ
jgi:hypothetical protein